MVFVQLLIQCEWLNLLFPQTEAPLPVAEMSELTICMLLICYNVQE